MPHNPPLDKELGITIYRPVQEALTNVAKQRPRHARRSGDEYGRRAVTVAVLDNGVGFDVHERTSGFGLAGMRERVYLADGELEVRSDRRGTLVRGTLAVRAPQEDADQLGADRVAG